jgi:hypothetical protein
MSQKDKTIKITPDYVIDEYLKAKKLKGLKYKTAIARVKFLSQNLNKFIPESV